MKYPLLICLVIVLSFNSTAQQTPPPVIASAILGGSALESSESPVVKIGNSFYLAAVTSSSNGYVTGNSGMSDVWLDNNLNFQWGKCLGTAHYESVRGKCLQATYDGGLILAAFSNSTLDAACRTPFTPIAGS